MSLNQTQRTMHAYAYARARLHAYALLLPSSMTSAAPRTSCWRRARTCSGLSLSAASLSARAHARARAQERKHTHRNTSNGGWRENARPMNEARIAKAGEAPRIHPNAYTTKRTCACVYVRAAREATREPTDLGRPRLARAACPRPCWPVPRRHHPRRPLQLQGRPWKAWLGSTAAKAAWSAAGARRCVGAAAAAAAAVCVVAPLRATSQGARAAVARAFPRSPQVLTKKRKKEKKR